MYDTCQRHHHSSTCAHCCIRSNLRMLIVCHYVTADVDTTNAHATACETCLSPCLPLRRLPHDVLFSCLLQHLQEFTSLHHCAFHRVLHTFVRHSRRSNRCVTYDPAGHWAATRRPTNIARPMLIVEMLVLQLLIIEMRCPSYCSCSSYYLLDCSSEWGDWTRTLRAGD